MWVQLKIKLILETDVFRGTEIKILANTFGARISKLLKRSRSKIDRTSYQRWSIKKGDLRNFVKFIGKHMCRSLYFFCEVAGPEHLFLQNPFGLLPLYRKKMFVIVNDTNKIFHESWVFYYSDFFHDASIQMGNIWQIIWEFRYIGISYLEGSNYSIIKNNFQTVTSRI